MPAGRPSKFDEDTEAKVVKMAKIGLTDAQMAELLDVTEQTFNNWKKAKPKFFESLKSAKAVADAEVERSLYERAMGYRHPDTKMFYDKDAGVVSEEYIKHYPPDVTACIFWLKNRKPSEWRDKVDHDHSGKIQAEAKIEPTMADDELMKRIKELTGNGA